MAAVLNGWEETVSSAVSDKLKRGGKGFEILWKKRVILTKLTRFCGGSSSRLSAEGKLLKRTALLADDVPKAHDRAKERSNGRAIRASGSG